MKSRNIFCLIVAASIATQATALFNPFKNLSLFPTNDKNKTPFLPEALRFSNIKNNVQKLYTKTKNKTKKLCKKHPKVCIVTLVATSLAALSGVAFFAKKIIKKKINPKESLSFFAKTKNLLFSKVGIFAGVGLLSVGALALLFKRIFNKGKGKGDDDSPEGRQRKIDEIIINLTQKNVNIGEIKKRGYSEELVEQARIQIAATKKGDIRLKIRNNSEVTNEELQQEGYPIELIKNAREELKQEARNSRPFDDDNQEEEQEEQERIFREKEAAEQERLRKEAEEERRKKEEEKLGHVTFYGVEYNVNDYNDWAQLKIQWPYGSSEPEQKSVVTQEQEKVLKYLSQEKKEELAFEYTKFKINKIERNIKEAKKISDLDWQEAIQLAQKHSQYKPHIGKILQEEKSKVEESARALKNVKEKLYSKEKDISPQEWKLAGEAVDVLPSYDENMAKIIQRDLAHVVKYAKLIDNAHDAYCNGSSSTLVRKLKMCHGKLQEYKSFLSRVKL